MSDNQVQRKRILGLLDNFPDEGLDELEEAILDIIEFHRIRRNYNPPPASQPEVIRTFPVVGTITHPSFTIWDDDPHAPRNEDAR